MRISCFGNSLQSSTLVLLYMNLVVNIFYFKSVWYDFYDTENENNSKMYTVGVIFMAFETITLIVTIFSVNKRKSLMVDWAIITLICNSCLIIYTAIIAGQEIEIKMENKVENWKKNHFQESLESKSELNGQTEILLTILIEWLYRLGCIVLKVYSALTIHRYRNELEFPQLIDTLLERNIPPSPKPPGFELWYPPPGEPDPNDCEAPPPYSVVVVEKY